MSGLVCIALYNVSWISSVIFDPHWGLSFPSPKATHLLKASLYTVRNSQSANYSLSLVLFQFFSTACQDWKLPVHQAGWFPIFLLSLFIPVIQISGVEVTHCFPFFPKVTSGLSVTYLLKLSTIIILITIILTIPMHHHPFSLLSFSSPWWKPPDSLKTSAKYPTAFYTPLTSKL